MPSTTEPAFNGLRVPRTRWFAFEEVYRCGFQAASLDRILAKAGVTKGALYHHFADKAALGYAVVDEVVKGLLLQRWLGLLDQQTGDPLTSLQRVLRHRAASLTAEEIELGCPLNNLAQEMSPLDERFRRLVDATFEAWRKGFAQALQGGQAGGTACARRRGTAGAWYRAEWRAANDAATSSSAGPTVTAPVRTNDGGG